MSKTALFGLTKAAALQLAPENITVNCVAPGIIKTKFASFVSKYSLYEINQNNCLNFS